MLSRYIGIILSALILLLADTFVFALDENIDGFGKDLIISQESFKACGVFIAWPSVLDEQIIQGRFLRQSENGSSANQRSVPLKSLFCFYRSNCNFLI